MGVEIKAHFTDTRDNKTFRDHKVSLTKDEIKYFINRLKYIQSLLGNERKKPTNSEITNNHLYTFRRGIYSVKNLKVGHILKEDDLITLRPNEGISADKFYEIIGSKVKKPIKILEKITFEHLV